jgi:hypothetical protein
MAAVCLLGAMRVEHKFGSLGPDLSGHAISNVPTLPQVQTPDPPPPPDPTPAALALADG